MVDTELAYHPIVLMVAISWYNQFGPSCQSFFTVPDYKTSCNKIVHICAWVHIRAWVHIGTWVHIGSRYTDTLFLEGLGKDLTFILI